MLFTPPNITTLEPNQIFVFGSNTEGIHGAGAAKQALKFGAVMGNPSGLQGKTYAIITKDLSKGERGLSLEFVHYQIFKFIEFARKHPEYEFLVTPIGCGLAGFEPHEMLAPFQDEFGDFLTALPKHIILPKCFYAAC